MSQYRPSGLVALIVFVGVVALGFAPACSSEDDPASDGDAETGLEDRETGEPEGEIEEGEIEEEAADIGEDREGEAEAEALSRVPVEGTLGYCTLPEPLDTSCADASDCRGLRVPLPVDCQSEYPYISGEECVFVNADAHPREADCAADDGCDARPRDCVGGVCVDVPPPDECATSSDCVVTEDGCSCLSVSADQKDSYSPILGADCVPEGCPSGVFSQCVDGHCRKAGTFMDEAIEAYCERLAECVSKESDLAESCVAGLKDMDYQFAAAQWPWIQASRLATTCQGLFNPNGPGGGLYQCIISESE